MRGERGDDVAVRPAWGTLLFASSPLDPRSRRPADLVMGIVSLLTVILVSVLSEVADDLDAAFSDVLSRLPPFLDPLWRGGAIAAAAWSLVLLAAALVRRRPALARDMVAALVVGWLVAVLVSAIVTDDAWAPLSRLGDVDGPPVFSPGLLTASSALLAVASTHLSRPFRYLGRWLLAAQFVGMVCLGATYVSGGIVAVAAGLLAASIVHLAVGSPGGRPTSSRIELALRELGVEVDDLEPAEVPSDGVVRFVGTDRSGPIDVKVYGRDAWDAQLLANLWRVLWYRGAQRTLPLSRLQLVEHEGFITLLAERAGVVVPSLVTAGSAGQGDALVVARRDSRPLDQVGAAETISDDALDVLWRDLRHLHDAGIVHRRLDLDRVVVRDDGTLRFGDLSSASVAESRADRHYDEAQAMALGLVLAGEERAVTAARRALGDDGVLAMLPYLQHAALPVGVRARLDSTDVELDEVRERVRTTLGADEQPLIRLRRVTLGSLINLLLLLIAASALISAFSDMDLDTFVEELADARWWWLVLALLLAQLPRVPAAMSTMGSIATPLPFGPLMALQFAICFVNLAVPSTAARVAVNVRFFQRFGVPPATAMTAGVIDSVSGFIVQIVLFLTLFFASDLDLGLTFDTSDISGVATIALLVLVAIVVAVIVVLVVPSVRRRVVAVLRQSIDALRVLQSPSKAVQLFGGNLLSQVLFAVAFSACASAFGEDLPLSQLLLINTVVSCFAGLLPIPGGIGVSEMGLTLGLTSAGVSSEKAFAIALAYRFVSFYLPPIWGWWCYRWLVQRRYL